MDPPLDVLVFGDQTGDYLTAFQHVLHIQDDALLTAFLDKTYLTLREEVSKQPLSVREQIPGFSSIGDLVARYSEPGCSRSNALESALTCISQLACFFNYQSAQRVGYPSPARTRIVGSCTGLLAAAAVGSAQSLVDLLPIALQAVRIAFRLGVVVADARDEIEWAPIKSPSWSATLSGLQVANVEDILKKFHDLNCTPLRSRAYISAVSTNGLTVSGPHQILDRLFQLEELRDAKPTRLPIHGPYHAPHVFDEQAVHDFCGSFNLDALPSHQLQIPLSSTSMKSWYSSVSFAELIQHVVKDIIVNTLRWDYVLDNVLEATRECEGSQCNIVRLGPSSAGQSLVSALRQKAGLRLSLDDRFVHDPDGTQRGQGSAQENRSKIAICGLSGRFPDAADHEAFWKLLEKGLDLHREVPKDRFDVTTHVDAQGRRTNTSHSPYGCFIEQPGLFDPRFFSMSPREAAQTDPMHRLALVTAYEALEMSGYVPNRTPSTKLDRIGTFYGQTSDDYREVQASQKIDTYFIPGGIRAFAPGRINYYFKFSGPSFSIDTACSSSMAAIQLACTSLGAGECDMALAGGMNILSNPDFFSGLSRGQFLSKTGPCATFDNDADGYCRADGVGSVVLKRLEDAEADKDPILAVILGAATNHSAEAVSITHPHAGAQEFLYKKVLNAANVDPHDISYVEMHGTGTQAGDATEMVSVTNTFAPRHRRRRPDQPLYLGAVKANAGHAEAASGTTSLAKVLMMMEKSTIPPHCGIKGTINRNFPKDLEERNVHIAFEPKAWKRNDGAKRRLFLNNFSAAGGNTALLLEDGPVKPAMDDRKDKRSIHIVAVSAKSKISLKRNTENLITYLEQNSAVSLPSISYTTTARRFQHSFRVTVAGADLPKVKEALRSSLTRDVTQIPKSAPLVPFMFTGQGSHYISMANELFNSSFRFRSDVERFDKNAQAQGFSSILPLIDGTETDMQALSPLVVQLGAVCIQMALCRLFQYWGIKPTVVVGHSLGEYAALNAAGVLSASDTIYLVGQRAKLLQEKCYSGSHSMLAIKASLSALGRVLDGGGCEVACINAPEETVVSGTNLNIDLLIENLKEQGFKATKLPVPFAFHSAQVEAILDDFEEAAKGVIFNAPTIPVISPLLNKVVDSEGTFDPSYLRRHCRDAVNFLGGLEAAKHANLVAESSLWVEIGSHPLCSAMIKATLGPQAKTTPSLRRNEADWKIITGSLCMLHDAGLPIHWNQYHQEFNSSHELLRLPTYSFDNKNYWIPYTNNWTLAKGDPEVAAEVSNAKPQFSAASVHRIVEQDLEGDNPKITAESDLSEPLIRQVIEGHEVSGFGTAPPSLYADMALTVAKHFYQQIYPDAEPADMNAISMKVEKPLVATEKDQQLLRIAGTFRKASNQVDFELYSVDSEGKKTVTHATCGVKFEDAKQWLSTWERNAFMVKSRIDSLMKGVKEGENDLIKRGMAYKLFGGLIHYGHKYRGMEEVVLNNAQLEATASVVFQTQGTDDKFMRSPYRTDSVAHISGFVMVSNEKADTSKEVYVSQGWDNYRVAQPWSMGKKYRSYVKMQRESEKMVVGDVYVFEGEAIVAVVEGLRFHSLPRQLVDSTLAAASGKPKQTKSVPAMPQKQEPKPTRPKPKSDPKVSATPKDTSSGITVRALDIVAGEVGVPASDLADESSFADLGVDSLLALTISGKFRESLNLEVASTMFVEHPTVKELKQFMAQHEGTNDEREQSPDSSSNAATPSLSSRSDEGSAPLSSVTSNEGPQPPASGDGAKDTNIRSTVAEQLGVAAEEIDGSSDLASLGMDSLMSLSILGKLREATGQDLPSDFFTDKPTFGDIEKSLATKSEPDNQAKPQEVNTQNLDSFAQDDAQITEDINTEPNRGRDQAPKTAPQDPPAATSVLLQGSPKTASKTLFFFPDGSGSATSYSLLPTISPNVAVYGLNSPFIKCPSAYTIGVPGLTTLYIAEILRRQPEGPYYLGGWSAGGICAYEAALQLQSQGRSVERLILLDTTCPSLLDTMPGSLHPWLKSVGLLGPDGNQEGAPEWLVPHFQASVRNLVEYQPATMQTSGEPQPPRTYALWAKDGVCKFPTDPRPPLEKTPEGKCIEQPKSTTWLLENREGPQLKFNGWDYYLGEDNIVETSVLEGANHFTMMREEHAEKVGAFIKNAMA
ncbi:MAG: hypothetical protein Q9163_003866 [Psora crenata]